MVNFIYFQILLVNRRLNRLLKVILVNTGKYNNNNRSINFIYTIPNNHMFIGGKVMFTRSVSDTGMTANQSPTASEMMMYHKTHDRRLRTKNSPNVCQSREELVKTKVSPMINTKI